MLENLASLRGRELAGENTWRARCSWIYCLIDILATESETADFVLIYLLCIQIPVGRLCDLWVLFLSSFTNQQVFTGLLDIHPFEVFTSKCFWLS